MSACRFCGKENEDWMKICQECGNPIIDSSKDKDDDENDDSNYDYSSSAEPQNNKFKILKIIILVLSIVLIGLVIYTAYVVITDKGSDNDIVEETKKDDDSQQNIDPYEVVSGYTWEAADGSIIYFNTDKTFEWYQSKDDMTDNFYEGTYELYVGESAISYVANDLKSYGVTEEEQRTMIENRNVDINTYYSIRLINSSVTLSGEKKELENNDTYYFGFLDNDVFDLANMGTANYAKFTKGEAI